MKRSAQAKWQGDLKSGTGTLSTASGTLATTPYSFHSRFEQGKGTNPEELLAAAHAGCFTMALSAQLGEAGLKATSLETSCTITLEQKDGGFAITESHLELKAKVPGATAEAFEKATKAAETGCPVSKLFNTKITLDAHLEA
jgi:osmotically inducible protein OsmC